MLLPKSDAPPDMVEALRRIEERADRRYESLKLLGVPSNIALWALLTRATDVVEDAIERYGVNTDSFQATLINLGRFVPVAMRWTVDYGKPASKLAKRRWTEPLSSVTGDALAVAHQYHGGFLTCFPMWHKGRYAAELISPTVARFTLPRSGRNYQVSAYHKGFRPTAGLRKVQRPTQPEQTPQVRQLFERVYRDCMHSGAMRFEYRDPWDLWFELLPEYRARLAGIARRADSLSLGEYTLGEFKEFYAALMAICAAHEHLCFAWGKNHGKYPLDSAVLVRSFSSWTTAISRLCGVSLGKCRAILNDLSVDFDRALDLHIHPFVPLDSSTLALAVAPQFPLHSLSDENSLGVCSTGKPSVFAAASLAKETEARDSLLKMHSSYGLEGPISLPKPNPDIDLLVTDESSSTIGVTELKWIRKPTRPVETIDRDAEVLKGIRQLEQIRAYLEANPAYLKSRCKLPRNVQEYAHIYYLLVARDHWPWTEPSNGIAVLDFSVFSAALAQPGPLNSALDDLLHYEWLPLEGRDFEVRYDRSTVNGVSVESETFYSV